MFNRAFIVTLITVLTVVCHGEMPESRDLHIELKEKQAELDKAGEILTTAVIVESKAVIRISFKYLLALYGSYRSWQLQRTQRTFRASILGIIVLGTVINSGPGDYLTVKIPTDHLMKVLAAYREKQREVENLQKLIDPSPKEKPSS